MANVVIYSTTNCPYCVWARKLLQSKGVGYTEIHVDKEPSIRPEMERRSGRTTVPQIFIDDFHVGGFDDLTALDRGGRLDTLLGLK